MALENSKDGGIWAGTDGGGLNYFDPADRNFQQYWNIPSDSTTLSNNYVTSLLEDSAGNLWVGTQNGLNILDSKTHQFSTYYKSDQLIDDHITCLYELPAGTLWIGTDSGYLIRYDVEENIFTTVKPDIINPNPDHSNYISNISGDQKNNLWISIFLDGVYRYNIDTDDVKLYRLQPFDPHYVTIYAPFSIQSDQNNNVWIGSPFGLAHLNPDDDQFSYYRIETHNRNSIAGNTIRSIFIDNQQSVWFGTGNNGVSRYSPNLIKFKYFQNNDDDSTSLSKNTVYSFAEDHSGNIWIGTSGGGLNKLNADGKSFTVKRYNDTDPQAWSYNYIMDLICDNQDNLWLGTWESGIFKYNPKSDTFLNYHHLNQNNNSLSGNRVLSIHEDRRKIIWIGTSEKGLNRFDPETGIFEHFIHDPLDHATISGNTIYSIKEDSDGFIWFGTHDGGLDRYNPQSQSFTSYQFSPEGVHGKHGSHIRSITFDNKGLIWLGTYGSGLFCFNPKTEKYDQYKVEDGLPSNVIKGVLVDDDGFQWISSNKGLSKFDVESGVFTNFTTENGIQGDEFRYESCLKSSSSEMYFGGTNGINVFHPKDIVENQFQAPVLLTDIKVNYESINPVASHLLKQISLSYNDKVIGFEFAALDFSAPNKNQYSYQLEGFNQKWIQAGSQNHVTYTNLDPGHYTFRVKGSNSDGIWSDQVAALSIYMAPPIWKTFWFRLFAFLLLVGIIFTIFQLRFRRLRLIQQRRMEKEHIQLQLDLQQRGLVTKSMDLIEKQEFMEELLSQIKYLSKISEPERKKQIGVLVRKLTNLLSFNQVWEEFEKWFTKIHSGFIESLRSKHSNLSITEIKVCALLRLNMNSKEIASLMNIQPESVSMSRYRIRKKLALPRKQNLNEYLSQF